MRNILISFLGTGDYKEARYKLDDSLVSDRNKYFQVALCQLLKQKGYNIDKIVVFLTEGAKSKHWDNKLEVELRGIYGGQIEAVDIPSGQSENQMWEIFNQIGTKLKTETQGEEDVRLIIDITHGFRALPVTLILALLFYKNIYGFNIESVYYGAFDAKEKINDEEVSLIFDLTPMIGLAEWSESLMEWRETGRGDIFTKKMVNLTRYLKSQKRGKLPFEEIIISLNLLNAANDILKVEDIFYQSVAAGCKMDGFREEAEKILSDFPMMSPVNEIIEYIRSDILSVKGISGEKNTKMIGEGREININFISKDTLFNMISLAEWYLKRRRIIETFSVLRETLAICAAYIITKKIGVSDIDFDVNKKNFWDECLYTVRSVCNNDMYPDPGDVFPNCGDRAKEKILSHLNSWFNERPELAEMFKTLEDQIGKKRNSIDHCFLGTSEKLNWKEPLKDYIDNAGEYIEKTRQLVDLVDK